MKRFSTKQEFEIAEYISNKVIENNPELISKEDELDEFIWEFISQLSEDLIQNNYLN